VYFFPEFPNSRPTRARKSLLLLQRALNAGVLKVVMQALLLKLLHHSDQAWSPALP
jgi:hypothetical protein